MQKRTKVIIRNVILSPLIFLSFIFASLSYFFETISEALPYWKSLPMSDKHQKIYDDKKEKERKELIERIEKSSDRAKVDLPSGYGNILIPTQFKEVLAEYKEYNS